MNLDADDLVLFARVAEAGSFSRASERCGLPKATVSRRIGKLEAKLGERLMTRTTRQLAITEFGEHILEHARRLLEETQAVSALAQHRQAIPQGTLRVSLPPGFLEELGLVPFLIGFAERHPEVRLALDISPRRVDVIAERFDLAVRVAVRLPDDATLVARRMIDLQQGLYASPAYLAGRGRPAAPWQLHEHTALQLIASDGEPQPWRLARASEHWEGLPAGQMAVNSIGLVGTLAIHGMGIAGLHERAARPLVARGQLERVLPDWCLPTMTVWCVMPGRRLLPARTRAFVGMLATTLSAGGEGDV